MNNENLKVYAAYAQNDNLRLKSSSGGIFSLIAKDILKNNGVVYGVKMTDDCKAAEFTRVENIVDLETLQGSKYLQANLGNTYKKVKQDLDAGFEVLFSGTGCQVNGLKYFLGKKYDNLYCIDVICHGVPSPLLWKKYVSYMEEKNKAKLVSVNFRCKNNGWEDFGMKESLQDDNTKSLFISKDKDPYMRMFLIDSCLRPSCYKCKAKEIKLADITLADFWGISSVAPEMNDGKGTSLVLVRTEKGKQLFDALFSELICKEVSYEDGVRSNPAEFRSAKRPECRNTFFEDMQQLSFDNLKLIYGMPVKVPFKIKIKKLIKKILMKTPTRKMFGGGITYNEYGLLFVFKI